MSELEFESRMSDADALMWNIEKDPVLRSTITAVTVLDRAPDRDRLMDKIERGSLVVPRLRQRVVGNPFSLAPPRWEVDPNFDLRYHVRFVRAGGDGSMRSLLDIAEPIAMQGFDRARPLWEFVIVEGLADDRAAIIQKLHHAITDGVGGVKIAMLLLDLEREASADDSPLPEAPVAAPLGAAERTLDAATHIVRRNLGIARRAGSTVTSAVTSVARDPAAAAREGADLLGSIARLMAPATDPLSPIMRARSLSVRFDTISVPVAQAKAAAKKAEGKLNDAFVAAVLGGLRRYHDEMGSPVDSLRMNMPINVRGDATANVAGNQFVPARFAVPLGIDDPLERMRAVRDLVAGQRGEPALALTEPLSGILNRLPTTVTTAVFGSMLKGVDFTTSNVPGAPIPVFMAGAELVEMYPFGPLAGAAVNITLLSHLDALCVGVNVDTAAVTEPERFHRCLEEGFAEILAVA